MTRRPGTRRWLKMGVELEGAWDKNYRDVAAEIQGAAGKTDGSVRGLTGNMGEITTRPHTILDHLCNDVVKLYPNRVNDSCGFHIHASFNHLDYSMLMDEPFWLYYRARWEAWGKANEAQMGDVPKREFWDRWFGRGDKARRYCKAEFKPVAQFTDHADDRYTQLNFLSYHKYQTVESRLLPMFTTAELSVLAIREMSDIFDTYLNEHEFPKITLEQEFQSEDGVAVEVKKVRMPNISYWEETHDENPTKSLEVGEDVFYSIRGAHELMLPFNTDITTEEP